MVILLLSLSGCALFPKEEVEDDTGDPAEDSNSDSDSGADSADTDPIYDIDPSTLPAGPAPCRDPVIARVSDGVDGDTFWVDVEHGGPEKVRIIGVDTPEIAHDDPADCYGDAAAAFTAEALVGLRVWLTFDYDCEDYYGRTLAYVHTSAEENGFYERVLLQGGLARVLAIPDNITFEDLFAEDEAEAQAAGAGLWGACE